MEREKIDDELVVVQAEVYKYEVFPKEVASNTLSLYQLLESIEFPKPVELYLILVTLVLSYLSKDI